jgi:hypothetical protein
VLGDRALIRVDSPDSTRLYLTTAAGAEQVASYPAARPAYPALAFRRLYEGRAYVIVSNRFGDGPTAARLLEIDGDVARRISPDGSEDADVAPNRRLLAASRPTDSKHVIEVLPF